MALEHRDYYREKKPDWDNVSFSKKQGPCLWSYFLFPLVSLVLFLVVYFYLLPSLRSFNPSVPVRSVQHDQSAPMLFSPDKFPSLPPQKILKQESLLKRFPVVRSVPAGYSGYIEVNGVRKEIYSPAVVSETYRYKSVSDVKFLPVKINGVEFDAMIDTGASFVSVGPAVIRALGVKEFIDRGIHNTAGGRKWAYYFLCSISLGSFEVSDIKCSYMPEAQDIMLVLGGSFLKNFNYSIDESSETITFALR